MYESFESSLRIIDKVLIQIFVKSVADSKKKTWYVFVYILNLWSDHHLLETD